MVNRYLYTDSWGNFLLSCPSATKGKPCIPNRYAFTGREWDPDIALYHYRARWYDPETKRFTQEDPVFESANKYKYVDNNPILYYDPDGYTAAPAVLTTGWTIAVLEPTPFGDAIMAGVTIGILAYSAISLSKGGKQRIRDTDMTFGDDGNAW